MYWHQMRRFYVDQFSATGRTQTAVARAGGLARQNVISKLLTQDHKGPPVETFIRAVLGLGLAPSAFFAALEQQLLASPTAPPHAEQLQMLPVALAPPIPAPRRPTHDASPSPTIVAAPVVASPAAITAQARRARAVADAVARQRAFSALVDTYVTELKRELARATELQRSTNRLDPHPHAHASGDSERPRGRARRRHRDRDIA